jgi:hypothetical protein
MILAHIIKQPAKFDCLKHPTVLQIESLEYSLFHLISLLIFALAILHTLCVYKVHDWARKLDIKERAKSQGKRLPRRFFVQILYFLAEVEIVFAFWAIPLFLTIWAFYGWTIGLEYINTRDYTEALFVAVILAMASTRPIIDIAQRFIHWVAKGLGGSLSAWWLVLLTVGPLLGSLITEGAAMAICALLLSRQFYEYHPSKSLAYATLGLLFVNISVGGILTNFASPAVLVLSHAWHWSISDIFLDFGWKATIGILLSNFLYWLYFRKELAHMNLRKQAVTIYAAYSTKLTEEPIPIWVTIAHIFFMSLIVMVSHYPAIFTALFLFFIGFHQATRPHQHSMRIVRPLLIGLFLSGLVIHGGLQGWWVVSILEDLSPLSVLGMSIALTGFNDNTAISYLATLLPSWGKLFQYALFTGVVAGGGLTVIANAPNPAGYAILKRHFEAGIKPIQLFLAAFIPTLILYILFYIFGPLI